MKSIVLIFSFAHSFSENKSVFKEKLLNTSGVIFYLFSLSQKKKKKKEKKNGGGGGGGGYHLFSFLCFERWVSESYFLIYVNATSASS